ncbi:Dynamin family-domain-containing protein [Coniochaeta sp. 2T2.1]|nr:Dynamin family-domain-containing protein [Coniochaeta sp. 2T2.1]
MRFPDSLPIFAAAGLADRTRTTGKDPDDTEEARWVKATGDLCARPTRGRTIIGVVGSTGAGKSSVINAVLDEERLLPTSCLSACTASATEVSYNYSDDPAQLYRAEIEFITLDEWLKELDGLFNDLLDSSGKVVMESSNAETDAGQALAKIRAVYPKLTNEMIERSDPESLANDPVVRHALGTTRNFQATAARILYRKVQNYVASKEKSAAASQNMEFWPLIKVVRIYTKAAELSTGAVIVDLPGVQDSNAARAAVAASYMKQCSALWIVAPMNRAVHDKTAKDLLGDQFKRQLKYDGIYDLVTFICSKTDDISNTEIDRINDTVRQLAQSIRDLKDQKAALRQTIDQVDGDTEVWEELDYQNANGRTVYAPPTNNSQSGGRKKRKRLQEDMKPAYVRCTQESGPGSYLRMKNHMCTHVEQARNTMFHRATDTVRNELKAICDAVGQELGKQILDAIFNNLSRDYMSVLGPDNDKAVSAITRAERMLRGELSSMLSQPADEVLKDCMEGDVSEHYTDNGLSEPDNDGEEHFDDRSDRPESDTTSEVSQWFETRSQSVDLGAVHEDPSEERSSGEGSSSES